MEKPVTKTVSRSARRAVGAAGGAGAGAAGGAGAGAGAGAMGAGGAARVVAVVPVFVAADRGDLLLEAALPAADLPWALANPAIVIHGDA